MVRIPAGVALIGPGVWDREKREYRPPSTEVVHGTFDIDVYEVTARAYLECVEAGACPTPVDGSRWCTGPKVEERGEHPINCLSFDDAKAYCDWAGKRLPTELEWEIAARGRDGRRFPWGNVRTVNWAGPVPEHCMGKGGGPNTSAVGCAPWDRSPFGVMDTAGNEMEWVLSWAEDAVLGSNPELADATFAGVRGGSWGVSSTWWDDLGTRHVVRHGRRDHFWAAPDYQAPSKRHAMYGPPGMRCVQGVPVDPAS